MGEESGAQTEVINEAKKEEKPVYRHVRNYLIKWFASAAVAGIIPLLPTLLSGTIPDSFLMELGGFYFGLTGAEMIYELAVEPLKIDVTSEDMWGFASRISAIALVVLFAYVFFTYSKYESFRLTHWIFVIFLGSLGVVLTCFKKGYAEGERYVNIA